MANFEDIMDVAVPWLIILVLGGLMYVKLKKPIDQVITWVKGLFGWGKEKVSSAGEKTYEIVYR